jgi:hypothetical protein
MAECEDLKKRVDHLEGEIDDLWQMIRVIHEESKKTVESMNRTIGAAENFRDRVLAALERSTGKQQIH